MVEVATLAELRRRAVHEFEVTFDEDVSATAFDAVENVADLRLSGRVMICRVTGPVDPFVKAIARFSVANVISRGADLEALFLAYYRGAEGAS